MKTTGKPRSQEGKEATRGGEDPAAHLEARVRKLAQEKSYLQLVLRLMQRIAAVSGLEGAIDNVLSSVVELIGGADLVLYYWIDQDLFRVDLSGVRTRLVGIEDEIVRRVAQVRKPQEVEHGFEDTELIAPEFTRAYTWAFPLLVGSDLIGIIKMESLQFTMRGLYAHLPAVFGYAAVVLKNEILGHTRLKKAHDALALEVAGRRLAEEKLLQVNEALEARVTERTAELRAAYDEIRRLQHYLASIIDSMPSILVGIDGRDVVTLWNRQAEAATGVPSSQAMGKSVHEVLPDFSPWLQAVRGDAGSRRPASLDMLTVEKGGERSLFDLVEYPLLAEGEEGAVLRIENVTERARTRELMVQTEKMMSLGGLAAGMAHEINNPLGIISQAAQNLERRTSLSLEANVAAAARLGVDMRDLCAYLEERKIFKYVGDIREATARAAQIVGNLLQFSRRSEARKQPASLASLLERSLQLAGSDYNLEKSYDFRSIDIVRDFQADLPLVPVVVVEFEQVVLNLLKNAAQALATPPLRERPQIVLRLRKAERHAVLEIEDNGPGMDETVRRRVFEPFFTTKEPGVGTGLGLSVSYTIVTQNHKGFLEVTSAPGAGTRFTVRLPLGREELA